MLCTAYTVPAATMVSQTFPQHCFIRYHDHKNLRRWRSMTTAATSASDSSYPKRSSNPKDTSSRHKFDQEALKTARNKFTREISFQSKDKDVSLAKALLYIAAEDEAFMVFNREMDSRSLLNESYQKPNIQI